jgi:phosphoribosylformylglycinamidine synthase
MAQAAVDEAVRNLMAVGTDFGRQESFLALVDNFCWPDPANDPWKAAALVRACHGLKDAALALGVPLISGKDSMKNDFHGKQGGKEVTISVPPTLLMTATGRLRDVQYARSADFKARGDLIYLIGGRRFGLLGSELHALRKVSLPSESGKVGVGLPDWSEAVRIYRWLGGSSGKGQVKLRSLHDVSDGGVLVAVAESMIARGLGCAIDIPETLEGAKIDPWVFAFGEGFHSFVASLPESEAAFIENELTGNDIPFQKIGIITGSDRLEVRSRDAAVNWNVDLRSLRSIWRKEGYWE